ncbi:uroporphyrinogen-III synthase [Marinicella rhabdoformis]|uniref:uroporphyrinogen-III synthase n=1 Tax=Marinicella rhabdoformis TaxID=2580566 RepID=UPI0012AECC47|nr:uroporphyrinogen-III synthase [Marinicella rhabdoformis]
MTTVIITRPKSKQQAALKIFKAQGFEVLSAPCINATSNPNIKLQWIEQAGQTEVLIVLNSHAIDALLTRYPGFSVSDKTQVIGIGKAVTSHWKKHLKAPITEASGNSESVIAILDRIKPRNITVLTSLGGRELIKAYALVKRINFTQLNCYIKQQLPLDLTAWQAVLANQKGVILTANSGQLLHLIQSQLPDHLWQQLLSSPLVTGASRITEMATQLGFKNTHTAQSPSNQDMLRAAIQIKSVG